MQRDLVGQYYCQGLLESEQIDASVALYPEKLSRSTEGQSRGRIAGHYGYFSVCVLNLVNVT